jgi:hypothetical protein
MQKRQIMRNRNRLKRIREKILFFCAIVLILSSTAETKMPPPQGAVEAFGLSGNLEQGGHGSKNGDGAVRRAIPDLHGLPEAGGGCPGRPRGVLQVCEDAGK